MKADLLEHYDNDSVTLNMRTVPALQLLSDLQLQTISSPETDIDALRFAAESCAFVLFSDVSLDEWLKRPGLKSDGIEPQQAFDIWWTYIDAVNQAEDIPTLDDLVTFTAIGCLARRIHEVRDYLRRAKPRDWLLRLHKELFQEPWNEHARGHISLALLCTVRQENHNDLKYTASLLNMLASNQKSFEAEWLKTRGNARREALSLLGMYHLAQAVLKTSEFILQGSLESPEGSAKDVSSELRRLLVKAEEFIQLTKDPLLKHWLNCIGILLAYLRESSIWVQARGISDTVDRLLNELTSTARSTPVFSLMPSQQDALLESLMDRQRVAIVLQMPTSAGKTLLAEFSIAQTFDSYKDASKVVYLVPTRALATQVRRTLTEDLGPIGIKVSMAGSAFEEDAFELNLLESNDGVFVATIEKLDLMLRAHPDWFENLRLVVVDEAHLLRDSERGVRLELLLANIKREFPSARLLLLTPFVDNAKEIGYWLGEKRSEAISITWRPSRILLGLAVFKGRYPNSTLEVEWQDPFSESRIPFPLNIKTGIKKSQISSNLDRVVYLENIVGKLGTTLALFSAMPSEAEKAAYKVSKNRTPISKSNSTASLRLAVALAKHEFGKNSQLAECLNKGVAFHHSSLSPILRYLIEDLLRSGTLNFVAATSTLAQGMNFPVANVLIHSVHKPSGGGDFSPGEFWNIAGRAGRVGLVEKGLVIFVDQNHASKLEHYKSILNESLKSALLAIIDKLLPTGNIKEQYRLLPALRPFIQYLAHAAANTTPEIALRNLEQLLQQSLVNQQITSAPQSAKLRQFARSYLLEISKSVSKGVLKSADTTGLGSFSFQELYASMLSRDILKAGPDEILKRGSEGIEQLIEVLKWIPEIDLGITDQPGTINARNVAKVVQSWIEGKQVHEFADNFTGDDNDRLRKAARYVYGKVSQTISWGAHAYLKGWSMTKEGRSQEEANNSLLASYIQYGVHTPEGVVASLVGVPRTFAEPIGEQYKATYGAVVPEKTSDFRKYVETANLNVWKTAVEVSGVEGAEPSDVRTIYRQMIGLPKSE